jgi:hypothetical protein
VPAPVEGDPSACRFQCGDQFNGCGENAHETFYLSASETHRASGGRPFAFCKTARKPYDEVVMKVLIISGFSLKDKIRITSDGRFSDEWWAVRAEMEDKCGIHTHEDRQLLAE